MESVLVTFATGVVGDLVNRVLTDRVAAFIREAVLTGSARDEVVNLEKNCKDIQSQMDLTCDDKWLFEVAMICYDAEDALDGILLGWLRKKKEKHFRLPKKHVDCIKDVNTRLNRKLSPQPTMASTSSQPRPPELRSNCEFREEIKKEIVEELLDDGPPGVTLILGVNGVGKTALADAVIKDTRITSEFNCIKIPVASAADLAEAEDIVIKYQQLTKRADDPEAAQLSKPKKLLILLDGLQNVESAEWHSFKSLIKELETKSKVLVTSRNPHVADVTGSGAHHLDELGSGDCYALIRRYAGSNENLNLVDRIALETFKEKLGTKCYGLPLLACRLGLLLSEQKEGQRVEKARHIDSEDILRLLKSEKSLSDLLPGFLPFESYTQRCLAYCSLFPSVHDFGEAGMVELWISEGFVQDSKRGLEKCARAYFDEIISHSIYRQPNQRGAGEKEGGYKMHKLFHDLAKQVFGEIGCGLVAGTSSFAPELMHIDFSLKRHLSLSCHDYQRDISKELSEHIGKAKRLRTFLLMGRAGRCIRTSPTFFVSLIYLRVLDLTHTNLTKLDISKLERLRFLDLSFTPVSDLGKLTKVFALRTLKLNDCKRLHQLPDDIFLKLTNLVCIEVRGAGLASMPPFIGKLINLQTLDDFVVGNKEGYKLTELALLKSLRKSLCIKRLENVQSHIEATQAKLSDKKHLRTLELQWSDPKLGDEATCKSTFEVLEALQPPENLATLRITNYCGDEFPQWLGNSDICGALETLELRGCNGCTNIPSELGQLGLLKILRIHNCSSLATLPSLKLLASLQELEIDGCTNLEQLPILPTSIETEGESIPSQLESSVPSALLRTLQVANCSRLATLPSLEHLTSLKVLDIHGCTNMEKLPSLPSSMRSEGGTLFIAECEMVMGRCGVGQADWEMIKDIPCVIIRAPSTAASTSPVPDERLTSQDHRNGSHIEEEESSSADFQQKRSADKAKESGSQNAGVASTSQGKQVGECVAPESCPPNVGVTSNSQNGTSNGPKKVGKRILGFFQSLSWKRGVGL